MASLPAGEPGLQEISWAAPADCIQSDNWGCRSIKHQVQGVLNVPSANINLPSPSSLPGATRAYYRQGNGGPAGQWIQAWASWFRPLLVTSGPGSTTMAEGSPGLVGLRQVSAASWEQNTEQEEPQASAVLLVVCTGHRLLPGLWWDLQDQPNPGSL